MIKIVGELKEKLTLFFFFHFGKYLLTYLLTYYLLQINKYRQINSMQCDCEVLCQ